MVMIRYAWRYFITGRPLHGPRLDNATLFRAATKDYRDGPLEKLSAPLWHRLARRWALLAVPFLIFQVAFLASIAQSVYTPSPAWSTAPWLVILLLWWGLSLAVIGGWKAGWALWRWHHQGRTSEFVYPAWQAACNVLGIHYTRQDARRNVHLPEGFVPADAIEEPGGHGRLARWTGVAWLLDRWAMAKVRRQVRRAEESDQEDQSEPDGVLVPLPQLRLPVLHRADLEPSPKLAVLDPPVRIYVIPGKCGNVKTQAALLAAVGPVLGMPDPKAQWVLRGRRPYVELRPNRLPPASVTFAQVRRHFEATDMAHPVIGLSAGNRPETIDYDNDSPHVMVSGGSGTGKSVLLKAILVQRMHEGAFLVVLDYKRISHRWAHGLAGVRYAWEISDIHYWAIEVGALLEHRLKNVIPEGSDPEAPIVQFPVVDVLVEEINSLTPQLQAWWAANKPDGGGSQSPAVEAIKRAVNMGREYHIHVHIAAQRASANVFGLNGGDTRESFQTRLMAKWTVQTWKMLAGGLPYQRCVTGRRGVWARVQGDDVTVVQTPYLADREAREWAVGGVRIPSEDDVFSDTGTTTLPPGWSSPPAPVDPPRPERVKLSEALTHLPGPAITKDNIRKISQRDQNFPRPLGIDGGAHLYDLDELILWKIERDRRLGLEGSAIVPAEPLHRPWIVYEFTVFYEGTEQVGYIGQTTRTLAEREEEHRADKPWADLILGTPVALWTSDSCTQSDLDAQEMHYIHTRRPRFNIDGQKGQPWQVPLWTQVEERQARNAAKGLVLWVPDHGVYDRRRGVS